jgi:Ca2+-binding RTX toxin-like protein
MRRLIAVVALAGGFALLGGTAEAGTVTIEDGVVTFRGAPGEENTVRIEAGGTTVTVEDWVPMTTPDCDQLDIDFVSCTVPKGTRVAVELGDIRDSVWVEARWVGRIAGGDGDDVITVFGPKVDGGDVYGGPGDDTLQYQTAVAGDLHGGPGDDFLAAEYDARGAVMEGGQGDDVLVAGYGSRGLVAHGDLGDDRLVGSSARDRLYGGPGLDSLEGKGQADRLFGELGSDLLFGGSGSDLIRGGRGGDHILGGPGRDIVHGDRDRDRLFMRDGQSDHVDGGPGRFDEAQIDARLDKLFDVEALF